MLMRDATALLLGGGEEETHRVIIRPVVHSTAMVMEVSVSSLSLGLPSTVEIYQGRAANRSHACSMPGLPFHAGQRSREERHRLPLNLSRY